MQLAFHFGCAAAAAGRATGPASIELPNPVIYGSGREIVATPVEPLENRGPLVRWQSGEDTWGMMTWEVAGGVGRAARSCYRALLAAAEGLSLHRIWNFIPRIDQPDGELDSYQAFCQGRALALEEQGKGDAVRSMPAATAVGTRGARLCVIFVAGTGRPQHVENPLQVPAHRYPPRYGPKAPTFARATLVHGERRRLYVSGTASIRGSDSLFPDDPTAQLTVALENLDAVAVAAGYGRGLNGRSPGRRRFRLYLRRQADWEAVEALLRRRLLRADDELHAVEADICRRELLVEIEARVEDE